MRVASAHATAVLPDAVGPKSATTLGSAGGIGLPVELALLRDDRAILLRVRGAVLAKPGDRTLEALLEGYLRLPGEQRPGLGDIRDVVGHLAEERRRHGQARLSPPPRAAERCC